jgi:hypothetical protein
MRLFVAAFVLSVACLASGSIAGETGGDAAASAASAASAPTAPTAPTANGAGANDVGSSDAARHAKRTECLKQAKAKKLVGEDRTAYVKTCLATP